MEVDVDNAEAGDVVEVDGDVDLIEVLEGGMDVVEGGVRLEWIQEVAVEGEGKR